MSEPRLEPLGVFEVDYDRPLPYEELNGRVFSHADPIWNSEVETILRHPLCTKQVGWKVVSLVLVTFSVPMSRDQVVEWARVNGYEVAGIEEAVAFVETLPNRYLDSPIILFGHAALQYHSVEVCPMIDKGAAIMDRCLLQVVCTGTFSATYQYLLIAT